MSNAANNTTNTTTNGATMTDLSTLFDAYFTIDATIARIVGTSFFNEDGLLDTSHLSTVNRRRVETLRRKRDAAKAALDAARGGRA